MIRKERNTRIITVIGLIVIATGFWLRISTSEWCLIFICIGGVFTAEALNTSIEKLSDFNTMEIDPRIRDIKDIAAGAVLVMVIFSVIVGALILLPKLYLMLI